MLSSDQFIKYVSGLAPEGETALLVRQRPRRDNAYAYTWPAFLPDKKPGPGEAWYINTGSFLPDRFPDGQPSASAACCEHVLFMVLDDVNTDKAPKTPPLKPTWRIETSPGSEQWGYVFSEQPRKALYTEVIKAVANAGYSDPGATNAVRNVRIPGSVNYKPGRDNFKARLIEWAPENEYTVDEILSAFGVQLDQTDVLPSATIATLDVRTKADGPVVDWLRANGLLLSETNPAGWCDVVCPNAGAHSTSAQAARFHPSDNGFVCLHAHCQDLSTETFLNWVADNGGPEVDAGLRSDLLAQRMADSMKKLTPAPNPIVEAVQQKERDRVEQANWFQRYAYIETDDAYFDLVNRKYVSRQAFNAIYRHITCKSVKNDRLCEASIWYDQNRTAMGGASLAGLTYAAGESAIVAHNGAMKGNLWVDGRPNVSAAPDLDVSLWLKHCQTIIHDERDLAHIFDVMAFKVQNPKVKINHAVLHMGDEGCGKDTMWAPFLWAVCGPSAQNRAIVNGGDLGSAWGYAYESEIIVLNELHEPEAAQRRALANRLKPLIAAPPDTISVNRKMLHPYEAANRLFVLAFSNETVPISLSSQDRRWFVVRTRTGRIPADDAARIWKFYQAGGYEAIARWLHARDVSRFNPAAPPPDTSEKEVMISGGLSAGEDFIISQIERRAGEFARGVVGSPWTGLIDRLQAQAPQGVRIFKQTLFHALKEAKWVNVGRCHSTDHVTKSDVWCAPDMAARSKADLRRLVDPPQAEGNIVTIRRG
jgi:hypothetical protein